MPHFAGLRIPANFVSRNFLESLGIEPRAINITISGINSTTSTATQTVIVHLQSRINSFNAKVDCIVTDQITDRLPVFTLKRSAFQIPRNLDLAHP